jgi:hypothetical protein
MPTTQRDRPEPAADALAGADPPPGVWSWLAVALLTGAMTALSTYQSLRQYEELRSGWSWDLAYYNQWYWALTQGDGTVTVRPISAYAQEGPSVWKMNYLSPMRFALAPIYRPFPDPRTLIVLQNVVFWWAIGAAYGLVRSESGSGAAALSAAALVPLTPLFWPLVWNDFRELQLVVPFLLWAVRGVRERSARWATAGVAGMLACRQEFAVMVATLAFLPPRRPESLTVTLRWRRALVLIGLVWVLFGFFTYLKIMVGRNAPNSFVDQFLGPKAPPGQTIGTASEILILGTGGWAVLMCLAPRAAILALPWIWSLSSGQWAMRVLGTSEWHSVRYAMPTAAMVLAAGLIGYARLWNGPRPRRAGRIGLAAVWLISVGLGAVGIRDVDRRLASVPAAIDRQEAREIGGWIRQVGPEDAVMADHRVCAPLSSRRRVYGYILKINLPPGFPRLGPEFRWLFIRNDWGYLPPLLDQGFDVVHRGRYLTIAHRRAINLVRRIPRRERRGEGAANRRRPAPAEAEGDGAQLLPGTREGTSYKIAIRADAGTRPSVGDARRARSLRRTRRVEPRSRAPNAGSPLWTYHP